MAFYNGTSNNDKLYGSGGDDKLYGKGGNDTLDGGAGKDTLYGGTGNDTFILHDSDVVYEYSKQGVDQVQSYLYSYTLPAYVENLSLHGNAIIGTGTSYHNEIDGNDKNNKLYGKGGNDTLDGGAGKDTLLGDSGNDILYGDSGDDSLTGDSGNDTLFGSAGNDSLTGGSGNDYLAGDYLDGNSGNDVLISGNTADSDLFRLWYYKGLGYATIQDFDDYNYSDDIADKLVLLSGAGNYYTTTTSYGTNIYLASDHSDLIAKVYTESGNPIDITDSNIAEYAIVPI